MPVLAQCVAVARHAFTVARRRGKDLAGREGGVVNGLLAGKPPSVNEEREYLRTRGWLPPGHEGGIADIAGQGFHKSLGIPGVAAGDAISAIHHRPFRYILAFAFFLALAALVVTVGDVSHVTHISARATLTVLGVIVAVPFGWWLLVTAVIVARLLYQASKNAKD